MNLLKFFLPRGLAIFFIAYFFSWRLCNRYIKLTDASIGSRKKWISFLIGYFCVLFFLMFTPNHVIHSKGIDLSVDFFDFVGSFKDRFSSGNWGINIIPFKTISNYIKYSSSFSIFINICGNILIFIPLGFLIPMIDNSKSFFKILLISFSTSIFIEFIQFFIGRSVDIDDVILNVLGGIIGYIFYKFISFVLDRFIDKNKTTTL